MGEALDQAKVKLGLGKNNPGGENPKGAVSSLEEVLSTIDNLDARDALRARVREVTANANLRATEAEDQLKRRGGVNVGDDEKKREDDKRIREEISTTAVLLLERGVDPKIVGQYIMGSNPITPISILPGGGGGAPQGLTISDVKDIMGMATEGKGTSELKETLEKLTAKIESLGSAKPLDPLSLARQQAESIRATYTALQEMGIIKEPAVVTEKGEALEVVRERNRHEERMEGIKADREYKRSITDIAATIPESMGKGLAGQFGEEGAPGGGNSGSGELDYFQCVEEGCGFRIPIPPNAGRQITCPKCGTVYKRETASEAKEE